MKTVKLTVAQALVKYLDVQYTRQDGKEEKFVEGISVIFGHGMVLGLGEALLHKDHGLKVFQGKNEQGQAHMAIGFAKQSGRKKIIAVASSTGPGSTNMITAAATATANNIPLLLLPSDTFASRQPDPVLQQLEQPYDLTISVNDAFKAVSRYFDRINRPEQLMTALVNAMRVLTDPAECGAVTIALPQDVQGESFDYPLSFFEKKVHVLRRQPTDEESLQNIVQLILKSKKTMLICGGGCKYSGAAAELKTFCTQFHIPFAETQAGKSTVESDFAYNLGGIGVTGNHSANTFAQKCDLVIGIGTRFTDFTTCSKWLFASSKIVQINLSDYHASKLNAIKLIGDAKTVLSQLVSALSELGFIGSHDKEIVKLKKVWDVECRRLAHTDQLKELPIEIKDSYNEQLQEFIDKTESKLSQTQVLSIINDHISKEAIVVAASGSLPGDLQRLWRVNIPNTYHVEYGYSCMGYEISAALGAKIASPDQEVYAFVGDAAFLMMHSDLVTSIQENKKITVCLFDNISNGCISNLQMGNGLASFCTDFRYRDSVSGELDGSLIAIDYAAIAKGYGCKAYQIRTKEQLIQALKESQVSSKTVLLDIKVLPKSMTKGYQSWWNVGLASQSPYEEVNQNYEKLERNRKKARKY